MRRSAHLDCAGGSAALAGGVASVIVDAVADAAGIGVGGGVDAVAVVVEDVAVVEDDVSAVGGAGECIDADTGPPALAVVAVSVRTVADSSAGVVVVADWPAVAAVAAWARIWLCSCEYRLKWRARPRRRPEIVRESLQLLPAKRRLLPIPLPCLRPPPCSAEDDGPAESDANVGDIADEDEDEETAGGASSAGVEEDDAVGNGPITAGVVAAGTGPASPPRALA